MTKVSRLHVPKLEFGWNSTYWLNRKFNLDGLVDLTTSFNVTPRLAIPYQSGYIDRGATTVNINAGYGEYVQLARKNRSVFLGPEYIQDANGQKPFSQYTLDDCRRAAKYAYDRAGGYGVITSGAQEGRYDNDPWAQLPLNSLQAYTWMSQAWGELMVDRNNEFVYFNCYDGILYFNPYDDTNALRTALSSNANAHAYMMAHSYPPNPYFTQELWKWHPPILNLYFRSFTDLNAKYFETRMAIQLTKMALAHVGKTWKPMVFVFEANTEFVDYIGMGYSEHYTRQLTGGGTYTAYHFPNYSPQFQWDQAFTALSQRCPYYGWEDTLLYGTNPDIVAVDQYRQSDNFPMRKRVGGNVQVVPEGPTPYQANGVYPYPYKPDGTHDLPPIAAEMYAEVARNWGGQSFQNAAHRPASGGSYSSLDSAYYLDRFIEKKPVVDVTQNGNIGTIKVSEYNARAPYDLDVKVPSGASVIVNVDPSNINLFTYDLNA